MKMILPEVGKKVYDMLTRSNVLIVGVSFENGITYSGEEQRNSYLCTYVWVKLDDGTIDGRYTWELGLEFNEDETDFIYLVYDDEFLRNLREIADFKLTEKQLEETEKENIQ